MPSSPTPQASASVDSSTGSLHTRQNPPSQTENARDAATWVAPSQAGYVGEHSVMSSCPSIPASSMSQIGTFPKHVREEILRVTGATSLPSPSKIQAFTDAYFKHLHHRAPIIDREDLVVGEPSILLLQAICLIGSCLRHPKDQSAVALSEQYYLKVKTLLYTNHETDNFIILKAFCILCFWNVISPVVVSLDGAWHWLGVAVRLAYHMGLHRESTYPKIPNPGASRRIMWFLFVSFKPADVRGALTFAR